MLYALDKSQRFAEDELFILEPCPASRLRYEIIRRSLETSPDQWDLIDQEEEVWLAHSAPFVNYLGREVRIGVTYRIRRGVVLQLRLLSYPGLDRPGRKIEHSGAILHPG